MTKDRRSWDQSDYENYRTELQAEGRRLEAQLLSNGKQVPGKSASENDLIQECDAMESRNAQMRVLVSLGAKAPDSTGTVTAHNRGIQYTGFTAKLIAAKQQKQKR
jgi:hypothetical protein